MDMVAILVVVFKKYLTANAQTYLHNCFMCLAVNRDDQIGHEFMILPHRIYLKIVNI